MATIQWDNLKGNTLRNVGKPKRATDGMTFAVPSYTTAEKLALPDIQNGTIVYDTTLNKIQGYQNGSWANLI